MLFSTTQVSHHLDRSEVLKSAIKVAASIGLLALSMRTHAGTLSGPTALFTLICCKAFPVVTTLYDIFGWDLVLNIKRSKIISQPWEIIANRD